VYFRVGMPIIPGMRKPSLVYFDLDRTLIDTTALIVAIQNQLATDLGWPLERVQKISREYVKQLDKSSDFELTGIISAYEAAGALRDTVEAAYSNSTYYRQSIYSEVTQLLAHLSKLGIPICIFSEGNQEWQTHKLELSGLARFFPEGSRLIFPRKTNAEAVAQLQAESLLIDDNPGVLRQVRLLREDVRCLWIDRNEREGEWADLERVRDLRPATIEQKLEVMGNGLEQLGNHRGECHVPVGNEGYDWENQRRNRRLATERED